METPGQTGVLPPQARSRQTQQIRLRRLAAAGDRGMSLGRQVETADKLQPRRRRLARLQAPLRRQQQLVETADKATERSADPAGPPTLWTVSLPAQCRHHLAPLAMLEASLEAPAVLSLT